MIRITPFEADGQAMQKLEFLHGRACPFAPRVTVSCA